MNLDENLDEEEKKMMNKIILTNKHKSENQEKHKRKRG